MVDPLPSPPSYKERLLRAVGDMPQDDEWMQNLDDMEMPEDKWYKEVAEESSHDQGELHPCPVIPVSKQEYETWCEKWKGSLIVNVLGKKAGFKILENKLHRSWARVGKISIIDMPQDYYLVNFSSLEDYKNALF